MGSTATGSPGCASASGAAPGNTSPRVASATRRESSLSSVNSLRVGRILQRLEREEREERGRRSVEQRPPGLVLLAEDAHQVALEQELQRGAAVDAANVVDFRARDRLAVGDDGERLQLRARQPHGTLARELADERRVLDARAVEPAAGDFVEHDAARRVRLLELRQRLAHLLDGRRRQPGELTRLHGPVAREHQRFEKTAQVRARELARRLDLGRGVVALGGRGVVAFRGCGVAVLLFRELERRQVVERREVRPVVAEHLLGLAAAHVDRGLGVPRTRRRHAPELGGGGVAGVARRQRVGRRSGGGWRGVRRGRTGLPGTHSGRSSSVGSAGSAGATSPAASTYSGPRGSDWKSRVILRRVISSKARKCDDEVELAGEPLEELLEHHALANGDDVGKLADPVGQADAIGDDVVRQPYLAPVEDPLEGFDEREERHIRERRLPRRALGDEIDGGHAAWKYVAPRDAASRELFPGLLVLLVLEQAADERLARVDLLFVEGVVFLSRRRRREEHLALDVSQRRGHDQVLGREIELHELHHREKLQVFLGDEPDGDIEDVELVLLAEVKEQIERALELRELHRPARRACLAGFAGVERPAFCAFYAVCHGDL